jgi:hypothetical protein
MNRLATTGSMSYGYSAQDGKRMVAYDNANPTNPTAVLNLYGPSGQRLSSITYYLSGGTDWVPTYASTNYLYLGSKPLNYSDDRLGSNVSALPVYGGGPAQYSRMGRCRAAGLLRKRRLSERMCRMSRDCCTRISGICIKIGNGF